MRCWPISQKVSASYSFYCVLWIVGRNGILNDEKFINKIESKSQLLKVGRFEK